MKKAVSSGVGSGWGARFQSQQRNSHCGNRLFDDVLMTGAKVNVKTTRRRTLSRSKRTKLKRNDDLGVGERPYVCILTVCFFISYFSLFQETPIPNPPHVAASLRPLSSFFLAVALSARRRPSAPLHSPPPLSFKWSSSTRSD